MKLQANITINLNAPLGAVFMLIYNRNTGLKGFVQYMKSMDLKGSFSIFKNKDYGSFMYMKTENIDFYGIPDKSFWSFVKEIEI